MAAVMARKRGDAWREGPHVYAGVREDGDQEPYKVDGGHDNGEVVCQRLRSAAVRAGVVVHGRKPVEAHVHLPHAIDVARDVSTAVAKHTHRGIVHAQLHCHALAEGVHVVAVLRVHQHLRQPDLVQCALDEDGEARLLAGHLAWKVRVHGATEVVDLGAAGRHVVEVALRAAEGLLEQGAAADPDGVAAVRVRRVRHLGLPPRQKLPVAVQAAQEVTLQAHGRQVGEARAGEAADHVARLVAEAAVRGHAGLVQQDAAQDAVAVGAADKAVAAEDALQGGGARVLPATGHQTVPKVVLRHEELPRLLHQGAAPTALVVLRQPAPPRGRLRPRRRLRGYLRLCGCGRVRRYHCIQCRLADDGKRPAVGAESQRLWARRRDGLAGVVRPDHALQKLLRGGDRL
mmetsp:Transcript_17785/g.45118  ORF Transcript_17785/g.45118 Transcript_17785/m.45118 type:complete len:402 (+) Transcript_17785:1927-3132(+)